MLENKNGLHLVPPPEVPQPTTPEGDLVAENTTLRAQVAALGAENAQLKADKAHWRHETGRLGAALAIERTQQEPTEVGVSHGDTQRVLKTSLRAKTTAEERAEEQRLKAEKATSESETDLPTGLYNRITFERKARELLNDDPDGSYSLVEVDLDKMKESNDSLGHPKTDEIYINPTVRFIQECVRKDEVVDGEIVRGDIVARWGGDEFVILVRGDAKSAEIIAERVRLMLADKVTNERDLYLTPAGKRLSVGLSIGVAEFVPGMSYDELLEETDKALLEAKRQGRNRTVIGTRKEDQENETEEVA